MGAWETVSTGHGGTRGPSWAKAAGSASHSGLVLDRLRLERSGQGFAKLL